MFAQLHTVTLTLAACLALAPSPRADGLSLGIAKFGRHGGISLQWSSGRGYPSQPWAYEACRPVRNRQVWVPGHYRVEPQRVWVEGSCSRVWIEPVYEVRYDSCGRPFKYCVAGGHYGTRRSEGHFETRHVQVWQPGHWVNACATGG